MKIIDGRQIAEKILQAAKIQKEHNNLQPELAIISIGENPASTAYIRKKIAAGLSIGVNVKVQNFAQSSQSELRETILKLNNDHNINGIILQLPVSGFNPEPALAIIDPNKDVDGLNPVNLGRLWQTGTVPLIPATPEAIIKVLEYIALAETKGKNEMQSLQTWLSGKHAVIINRSNIIGKPLAALLLHHDCTVTIAHSKTGNLEKILENADIVVSGTGKKNFLTDFPLKQDVVVIDVGFIKEDKTIYGDADAGFLKDKASWLSPVPNGIGPIGVAMLIANTVAAAKIQNSPEN